MTDRATLQKLMEGWQPPPELTRGRPRPVRLTIGGVMAVVVAVLCAAAAVAAVVASMVLERLEVLLGVTLAGVALLLAWKLRSERRLLEDGRPAPAIITRLGHPSEHGRYVYYEFPRLSGAPVKGRFGPVHKPPAVGSTLVVLYESDNPRHSARYPLVLVRLARL